MEGKPQPTSLYDYFIEHTDKRFDKLEALVTHQNGKIDSLNESRWFWIGGVTAVNGILTVLISIFIAAFFGGK